MQNFQRILLYVPLICTFYHLSIDSQTYNLCRINTKSGFSAVLMMHEIDEIPYKKKYMYSIPKTVLLIS